MENEAEKHREIARAILRYLRAHPDAKDTLEGIAQWWLLREWTEKTVAEVEGTVADLLSKGLLVERHRQGLSTYYWLNESKKDEISQILNGSDFQTR